MATEFALVDYDDGYSKDIPISCILKPRKEFSDYVVGERVEAKWPGLKGVFGGTIAAISSKNYISLFSTINKSQSFTGKTLRLCVFNGFDCNKTPEL